MKKYFNTRISSPSFLSREDVNDACFAIGLSSVFPLIGMLWVWLN